MHITAPYPEILGWIFLEELEKADRTVMNSRNARFYPTMKTGPGYQPMLPELQADQSFYRSLFFALPSARNNELYSDLVGPSNAANQGIISIPGGYIEYSARGSIAESLNLLHDYLMSGQGLEIENESFPYQSETIHLIIGTGRRFFTAWRRSSKQNLVSLIYILYFLRGSIS